MRYTRAVVAMTVGCSVWPTYAQSVSWSQVPSGPVPTGYNGQLAYHKPTDQLLLYGAGILYDEMWTFQGSTWTRRTPRVSPGDRGDYGICYRPDARDIFLFGGDRWTGSASLSLGDTWSWNGSRWQPLGFGGPARSGMAMAYDTDRKRIVMFGGVRSTLAGAIMLADTWEWDGLQWISVTTPVAPSPRVGSGMTYDPVRRRVVLFGGVFPGQYPLGDTWEYDGSTWTQLSPALAPGAREPSLTWDSAREVAVLFGGVDFTVPWVQFWTDTWEWDGSNWSQRLVTSPGGVYNAGTFRPVFDTKRRRVVSILNDPLTNARQLWSYGPTSPATVATYGAGCAGFSGPASLSPDSLPWIGSRMALTLSGAGAGVPVLLSAGTSNSNWLGTPLPLSLLPTACQVLASPEIVFSGLSDPQGTARWNLPLANIPSLVGRSVFIQGYALDQTVSTGFVTSNGVDAVVGAK